MKKLLFLIIIILVLSQTFIYTLPKTERGFKAGISCANAVGDLDNPRFVTGASFGIFYRKYYRKNRAVQYEINYTQKGYSTDIDEDWKETTTNHYLLTYLELPILFVFHINRTPFDYYFGPFGAVFLSGSVSSEFWGIPFSTPITTDVINSIDAGLMIGGRWAYDKFFIDARSSLGLLSFPKEGSALRNIVFQLSGGARF